MRKPIELVENTAGSRKYLYHDVIDAVSHPEHREIIAENPNVLHLVPYSHQIPDGFETLCYDLGEVHHGLIPLVHVFHPKRPIKLEELILLMHGIVGTILSGIKLGLFENSFILEPRYIYMKRNSTTPQLVYLPLKVDIPVKIGFGLLVHYLSGAYDRSSPLTAQIITALKHVVTGDFGFRDVATIVVQAANKQTVDKRFLKPHTNKPKVEPKGVFKKLVTTVTGKEEKAAYEDPFADFDVRTVISMTDSSGIDLNIAVLYVIEGNARVLQIPVTKEHFVLGRNPNEVDHCFEEKGISRIHAAITAEGSTYTVVDKGSSGGTFLNGKRLVPGQPEPIKHGDELVLYKKKLLFECK